MYLEENFWSGPGDPRQQNRQADRARMTQIANFHDSSLNEVTYGRLTSAFQRRRKSRTRSVPLTVPCLCQGSLRPTHQSRPGTVRPAVCHGSTALPVSLSNVSHSFYVDCPDAHPPQRHRKPHKHAPCRNR